MAVFQYRAADYSGKVVEGVMEADAESGVVAQLHEMGFIPLSIALPGDRRLAAFKTDHPLFARKAISPRQLLQFTQEIGTLLGAGLPLDRSLSVLAGVVEGEEFRRIVRLLLEGVRAGKSLSAAMAEHPEIFPRLYVNMVRAGESGGVLEGVLRHLAEYLSRSLELKEDIRSALTYPLVVVLVGAVSLSILFFFVIPKFSLLFRDVDQALPLLSKLMLRFSEGLSHYGWVALPVLLAGGVGFALYIRNPEGRLAWDSLKLRFWIVGDLLRKLEVARFARTLGALLRGGVPLLDALGTVQGIVANRVIARALVQVQTKVREGKGMTGPLTESKIFPPLALHMIAVGEETGKLEGMLNNVADHFDDEVKRTTKRLTSLLEPVLILAMGLVIGVVVISMLLAILSIYDLPGAR
ncbi:MAG TPA: type II secretion system F family protein [Candidatus Acidoferrales bacterium]|nr:type II secretion system F family protein [Candidatus Acidoferrales bacterium]